MKTLQREDIEVRNALLAVPFIPEPDSNSLNNWDFRTDEMTINRASSLPIKISQAVRNKNEISEYYRRKFIAGDRRALLKILEISPAFILEDWVKKAFDALTAQGKINSAARSYGRDWGGGIPRVILMGLMRQLKDKGLSDEEAFAKLTSIGLTYEHLKDKYYSALKDSRFKPLFFALEKWRPATVEEFDEAKKVGLV